MCWQCGKKPQDWLSIFESFKPVGWYFGKEAGDGVFEFRLEGKTYHTNPDVEIVEWMVDHIPGEIDQNGDHWFLEGEFTSRPGVVFRETF